MAEHVFVDESKKRDYLLVAAALPGSALPEARRALRTLLRPRQRRLHMVKESGSRQRQVLGVIRQLGPRVTVYRAESDGRSHAHRRAACLTALVSDACERRADSITLEREDSAEDRDRHTIFHQLDRLPPTLRPRYRHVRPDEEILLAVPDAIAWMWARNTVARRDIRPLLERVIVV